MIQFILFILLDTFFTELIDRNVFFIHDLRIGVNILLIEFILF